MEMNCAECGSVIRASNKSGEPDYVECSACNVKLHPVCSKLSASELKVFALKKAIRLRYCCDKCEAATDHGDLKTFLARLNRKIEFLQASNDTLLKEVQELRNNGNLESGPNSLSSNFEEMYDEIIDREKRSYNLILFGVDEGQENVSTQQRLIDDKQAAKTILTAIIDIDIGEFSTMRLGPNNKRGNPAKSSTDSQTNSPCSTRPLKVILKNRSCVLDILKHKKSNKSSIKISADRTPKQREHLKSLLSQMKANEEKGITGSKLKYRNGVPYIIISKDSTITNSIDSSSINQENT
ncbi:hypothetical protein R5R35_001817 [Gryllus longicercus]|uniref:Zinc finger PHD-type domain-containing protein n=1 Tax=Gryllus longicercus TaxID=2509291 RepID=A0AAN9VUF2_9ORTH